MIITNERADRYVRSLGSPKKRAVGFGAVKEKSVHAGQKALSTRSLGRHHQQPKSGKKAKQNGQAQQQPKAAHKERRQDKKNNKKTPAKRVASANTSNSSFFFSILFINMELLPFDFDFLMISTSVVFKLILATAFFKI